MEGLIAKQSLNSQKKKTMFGYRYQIYSALYQNPLLRSEMCPGVLENVMEKHLFWTTSANNFSWRNCFDGGDSKLKSVYCQKQPWK